MENTIPLWLWLNHTSSSSSQKNCVGLPVIESTRAEAIGGNSVGGQ
jgi:hypothetical protein